MSDFTAFQRKLPDIAMLFDEPMAKHCSFRIGGNARVMVFPGSVRELSAVLSACGELNLPPRILGAGTNVLPPDEGIDGVVICLKDKFDGMERLDETSIRVSAGVTMTRAAVFAANLGLSGMEFAHGIPGTVGGGVYMNAGAYGGEIKDICVSVDVMDRQGRIRTLSNGEMAFSYRHTMLERQGRIRTLSNGEMAFSYRHTMLEGSELIVVSAVIRLVKAEPAAVKEKMRELMARRSASQPLDMPSAGSAFKRPVGGYAAALIDRAGLKGYRVGGAAISEKHAGFAVNLGDATAEDVRELLSRVSDKVFEQSGIWLEPEIRIW